MNLVILIGNLGADPELRHTSGGTPVCTLRLATNSFYTNDGGQKIEQVEWHLVEAWGKQAENCAKYLGKGSKVSIQGSLTTQKWTDREGVARYTTKVKARAVEFLSSRSSTSSSSSEEGPPEDTPDELPYQD